MSTEEAQRAVNIWHDDDFPQTSLLSRRAVRDMWPALGDALDHAQPSDILDGIHPVVTDSELFDHAESARQALQKGASEPRILINWAACVTVVVSLLVGIACGMAIEFSVLTPGI